MTSFQFAYCSAALDPRSSGPGGKVRIGFRTGYVRGSAANIAGPKSRARDVYVTRLHLRYDDEHFPADLQFRETRDRSNFQGRYILRHPWRGPAKCDAAKRYLAGLPARFESEAQTLASLTGWPIQEIRDRMRDGNGTNVGSASTGDDAEWWRKIWPKRE